MKYLLVSIVIFLSMPPAFAQLDDDTPIDTEMFDENSAEISEVIAFIIDNTKTKLGRDFYEEFYRQWNGLQLDSLTTQRFKETVENNSDLIIELEEIPSPGITNLVSIKIGELTVWQQFVQTRIDALEFQTGDAVKEVFQYFLSYQEIQNQLGSEDQMGSGIF